LKFVHVQKSFCIRLGYGGGQRKYCEIRLLSRASNETSRTQFVGNCDRGIGTLVCAKRSGQRTFVAEQTGLHRGSAILLLVKLDVAVSQWECSYESFCASGGNFCWYGADAVLVCRHCACGDGKRLRWTRRLLRKSYSQWRASKLLSNDSGSSQIAIWHAGSGLS